MTKTKKKKRKQKEDLKGLRGWWKSPRVRKVRKRFSDTQRVLYPLIGTPLYFWVWLTHRFIKCDRHGPVFDTMREKKSFIFAVWHEDIFPAAFEFFRYSADLKMVAMASPGRAGTLGAYLLRHYNVPSVHGSNSLRGIEAVNEITDRVNSQGLSVIIAADGSRGPHREAAWGAIYLAKNTGLPIIACRCWGKHQVVLKSTWMKMALPVPWGRSVFISSEPMLVPEDSTKEELNGYRARLDDMLNTQADASVAYFERGPEAVGAWPPADPTNI